MKKILGIIALLSLTLFTVQAATFTANVNSGIWNLGETWGNPGDDVEGSGYPGPGDIAVVNPPLAGQFVVQITVTANQTVDSIALIGANTFAFVTVNSGISLTVNSGVLLQSTGFGVGILTLNGTGVLNSRGDLTFSGSASSQATVQMNGGASSLNLEGNLNLGSFGALTPGTTSTVNFVGTTAQTIPSSANFTYANIACNNTSSSGVALAANVTSSTVAGDITVESGILNTATFSLTGSGSNNLTVSSGGTLSIASTGGYPTGYSAVTFSDNSTVDYSNAGAQDVTNGTYSNLTISGSGTKTLVGGNAEVDRVFTIDAGTFNSGANSLVLNSDATRTAKFAELGSGAAFSGTMVAERFLDISTIDWIEISSPIQGTDLNDWEDDGLVMSGFLGTDFPSSTFISAYSYDESANAGSAINGWSAATTATESTGPASGYNVYAGNTTTTLFMTGTPYTGDQVINLSYTTAGGGGAAEIGWNLIGNPYPCTLDWDAIDIGNKNNIVNAIFTYCASCGNYGAYLGNSGGGTNNVSNLIASHQAFWVHANAASPQLTITESAKSTDDKAFVQLMEPTNQMRIRLTSDQNSYQDEALILLRPDATSNYHEREDAMKFFGGAWTAPKLTTFSADGTELAINSIDSKDIYYRVPIKAAPGWQESGMYNLSFSEFESLNTFDCLFVKDHKLDTIIDLRSAQDYEFYLDANDNEIRFTLYMYRLATADCKPLPQTGDSFSPEQVGAGTAQDTIVVDDGVGFEDLPNNYTGLDVFQTHDGVFVNFDFAGETEATITIFNTLGQPVAAPKTVSMDQGSVLVDLPESASSAIYILKVESESQTISRKLIQ